MLENRVHITINKEESVIEKNDNTRNIKQNITKLWIIIKHHVRIPRGDMEKQNVFS